MNQTNQNNDKEELNTLCISIKKLLEGFQFEKCEQLISEFMRKYPHAPEPHNLIGVTLEKQGDHISAMKHFRAAWALDPTYDPARINLEHYGTFSYRGEFDLGITEYIPTKEKRSYLRILAG